MVLLKTTMSAVQIVKREEISCKKSTKFLRIALISVNSLIDVILMMEEEKLSGRHLESFKLMPNILVLNLDAIYAIEKSFNT